MAIIVENKKAFFDYQILEKFRTGIVLQGQEVKSIRHGKINIQGSFIAIIRQEIFLIGAKIPAYQPKNVSKNYDPQRSRKLLLQKSEIKRLIGKPKGLTIVPLVVYTTNKRIKLEIGIVKGKKKFDKREQFKKREIEKMIDQKLKGDDRV